MRLRGDKWNDENAPTPRGPPAPKANGQKKMAQTRIGKSVPLASGAQSPSAGERAVLREKTNLEAQERAKPLRGRRKEGGEATPTVWAESIGVQKSPEKESCGVKGVTKKTQIGRGSIKALPQPVRDGPRDENNSLVTGRRRGGSRTLPRQAGGEPRDENNSLVTRRIGGSFIASPKQAGGEARDKKDSLVAVRREGSVITSSKQGKSEERDEKDISVTRRRKGSFIASSKQAGVETRDKNDSLGTWRRIEQEQSPRQAGGEPSGKKGSLVTGRRGSGLIASPKPAGGKSTDKNESLETRRRRGSFKSPKLVIGEPSNEIDIPVAERKHCVYMNAVSKPCMVTVSNKESIYDFEVDGNEPPSRRRRRRGRGPTTSKNKKKVFPRFPRVRFPSRSETTASSVESVTALSSFGWGSTASERTVSGEPSSVVASISKPTFAPPIARCSPRLDIKLRKRLSTVLESPPDTSVNMPAPHMPSNEVAGVDLPGDSRLQAGEAAVASRETTPSKVPRTVPPPDLHGNTDPCGNPRLLGGETALACGETTPSKVPRTTLSALHGNSCWHEEPSLGTSALSNANLSFSLGFAHHHSTPVKARSDSSSNFTQSQVDATADNCFGFSSDDDEGGDDGGMPSPLYASPHTCALRQALLTSSPQPVAPSRFAPEVVRRALILEAVSRPLQFDGGRPRRQQGGATVVVKKKRGGGQRRQKKVNKEFGQRSEGIDEYLLKRQGVDPVSPPESKNQDEAPAIGMTTTTPPLGSLFGDARDEAEVEEDAPAPLSVRPPRRSYERPWNRKLKKVIGGGLCLDSSDEDDEGREEGQEKRKEEGKGEKEMPPPPEVLKVPKAAVRHRTKAAENKENQLDQWASQINSQFDEVEDFELCLE